jgi:2-oxoglutarate ferredoxin oxidoreductase subunit beta
VDPEASDLHDSLDTVERPLNDLGGSDLIPGSSVLAKINADLR